MNGELYPGEFEAMERQGRLDAVIPEQKMMTSEEAIGNLKYAIRWNDMPKKEALEMAIKALEQEPCENTVSRQAVLDKKELVELEDGQSFYCISPEDVETLPPVTPKQRTGHWVESYINQIKGCNDIGHFYVCTECGRYINLSQGAKLSDYPYCHCGAKMQEVEE